MKKVLSFFLMFMFISFGARSQNVLNIYCGEAKVFEKDGDNGQYVTYSHSLISLNPTQFVVLYSDTDFHHDPSGMGLVAEKGIDLVRKWFDENKYLFSVSNEILIEGDDEPLRDFRSYVISFKDGICYIKDAFSSEPDTDDSYIEITLAPGQEQEIKNLLEKAIITIVK